MTVIGLDDTDSRERGMCTTFLAATVADRLRAAGAHVERTLLVRLNPAVEYKTRGNAALAVHTDAAPEDALAVVRDELGQAETADPRTNPGVVIAEAVPPAVGTFAESAVRDLLSIDDARELAADCGYELVERGNGRGLVGALAAVGAWRAFDDWTYECISYRERERWGTPREVDYESVFDAADDAYPDAWDTVDREEGQAVCVPRTPCPILHGIRGDDPDVVRDVAERIDGEPVASRALFQTNQGTDVHLQDGVVGDLDDGRAYRVDGSVVDPPETREGGHVFFALGDGDERVQCAAFEPTKRFRDRVRSLRTGDRLTVCGEVTDGTLKLEKFAVRDLDRTELVTPNCPDCGRSMKSAGRNQGYRCRDCGTSADGKVERPVERDLVRAWYEVPPCARRHVAKPLVRGGFDGPAIPEK
ncbi:tRNA(Ile)(2)-agmatinylcytidine synthase [Haloarculaceae archaeon H-GB2-1]|nr:tRNA(Ile)(2)-agmatinylcytidine synthase [Haloarculaceae archaeon H-GB1-1]MEA5385709.1 tRNA(Ile)(2)-agmatinylcytidine synthase [Haloarculaceae archaeon H-GB11]MEA5407210.1 tRNA(Ile)(2)-agmatinylcytidine synthase [Haloarculaceae archaeon H-GB2-1]